jgi:hypothetical protein
MKQELHDVKIGKCEDWKIGKCENGSLLAFVKIGSDPIANNLIMNHPKSNIHPL